MSDPVYEYRFTDDEKRQLEQQKKSRNTREVVAVVLLMLGALAMSVGVGGYLDSLWAGVAVAGFVLTVLGVLLGNN